MTFNMLNQDFRRYRLFDKALCVEIGVPFEDIGSIADAGQVRVFYGASFGLTTSGSQAWNQNSSGIEDSAESGDQFGHSVA
jgi:hypothetical protein